MNAPRGGYESSPRPVTDLAPPPRGPAPGARHSSREQFRDRLREIAGVPRRTMVAEPAPTEPEVVKRSTPRRGKTAKVDPDRPHAGDEGESGRST